MKSLGVEDQGGGQAQGQGPGQGQHNPGMEQILSESNNNGKS